ncbi:MAG: 50S ribosomal protein L24 [Candidatus Bathyarchaeota archaeon]|nr:50S ribosomal protein L24 [Candidatus Bathyarchaeota archaeon]
MKKRSKRPNIRRKQLSAMLSKALVEEYKVRSMQVRKGDTVQIMRGSFEGVEGAVTDVDYKRIYINVEGATREKSDGTIVFATIHPSKVAITRLILDDPRRKDILERRAISTRTTGQ